MTKRSLWPSGPDLMTGIVVFLGVLFVLSYAVDADGSCDTHDEVTQEDASAYPLEPRADARPAGRPRGRRGRPPGGR